MVIEATLERVRGGKGEGLEGRGRAGASVTKLAAGD